jgi:hypothetical protein
MTHAANLPRHQYVSVDKSVLSQGQVQGWEEAVWFGLNSVPHRAWACTVMLKCGALYRGLPLSAICHDPAGHTHKWELRDAQRWDCFGYNFATIEYDYLRELDCSCVDCQQAGVDGWQLYVYRRTLRRWLQPRA